MSKHLVFVYGTLKRGAWNHDRLLADAERLGAATTRQHYAMGGSDGGVPMVFDLPQHDLAAPVCGEVYAVDDATLADLDRLEGHPTFYCRKPISVRFDGTVAYAEAWLYFGPAGRIDRDPRPVIDGLHNWQPARAA